MVYAEFTVLLRIKKGQVKQYYAQRNAVEPLMFALLRSVPNKLIPCVEDFGISEKNLQRMRKEDWEVPHRP